MERKPAYYAILPASVRYDARLSANAKILYAEITSLSEMRGECNATNEYFSKLYEVDERTVSRWISLLQEHGYISTTMIREGEKTIRTIFLSESMPKNTGEKTEKSSPDKNVTPAVQGGQNRRRRVDKNVLQNTTLNNTTNKLTNSVSAEKKQNEIFDGNETENQALKKFNSWLSENAPRVTKLKEQISATQLAKLKNDYGVPIVMDVFQSMHNKADLIKQYVSAYLTANNWCKNRKETAVQGKTAQTTGNVRILRNAPVLEAGNGKFANWYLNNEQHPLLKITDQYGNWLASRSNELPAAQVIKRKTEITGAAFPDHVRARHNDFNNEYFAFFQGYDIAQPLGEAQKRNYEGGSLKPEAVRRGIIY